MSSTHVYIPLKSDDTNTKDTYMASPNVNDNLPLMTTTSYELELEQEIKSKSKWGAFWHEVVGKCRNGYKRNVGLLLVVAAQAFFSFMNLSVKKLNSIDPPVSALQLIVVRMGITTICSITYMLVARVQNPFTGPKGVRLLLLFRGFTGFFGLFGIYFSLQYLSLSDATVLTFLAPLCTAFSGAIFLGEHLNCRQVVAGLFSLVGVLLIARPPILFGHVILIEEGAGVGGDDDTMTITTDVRSVTSEERMFAVIVALVGVLGSTGAYTTLRAIGKRAHPLHSLVSFSSQSVIVASIGMIVTKEPFIIPTRLAWLAMLFMIGIFGFVAQILLTMGLARETAGRSSMAIYTQIVFATILERIFFHTSPSMLSIIGTCLIISAALYVAMLKADTGTQDKTKNQTSTSTSASSSSNLRREEEDVERGLLLEEHEYYELELEDQNRKDRDTGGIVTGSSA